MKRKRTFLLILTVFLMAAAIAFAAYPAISNYVDTKYQSTVRTDYVKQIHESDKSSLQKLWNAANAYNDAAALRPMQYDQDSIAAASVHYDNLLNPFGSGIMGYVEVPKLEINLPINHGTSESALQDGIGHLLGSSLPVGGKGTHTVLTGHSGVAGKKLFSDLDQLAVGDVFYLKILGKTLAYQVTEINTVLPYETELLRAVPGEDLCTLVTCTPFGVNSHRLLVRGSRIPYHGDPDPEIQVDPENQESGKPVVNSTWQDQYFLGLMIFGGITGAAILSFIAVLFLRHRKRRKEADRVEDA